MATSEPLNVASDLVQYFKLDAECHGSHTHIYTRVKGQRNSKKRETWTRTKAVGQGAFGMVWLERREGEGPEEVRAVKELRKDILGRRGTYLDYAQELFAMAKLTRDVDHFAEFYGWYENPEQVFLAMEYFELGDLGSYVANPMPEHEVKDIASQLLSGLELIHRYGLVHRDLKPQNVFVVQKSPAWWVKIGDFGISKKVTETTLVTVVGTGPYMAPEILNDDETEGYSYAVDMWSLGCLIYLLVAAKVPFENQRDVRAFLRGTFPFPITDLEQNKASPELCEFLMALLAAEPKYRPSASSALDMFWITQRHSQHPLQNNKLRPEDLSAAWRALAEQWTRNSGSELSKWISAVMPQSVTNYFTSMWETVTCLADTVIDMRKANSVSVQDIQQSLAEARKERSQLKDRLKLMEEELQAERQRAQSKDEEFAELKNRMTLLEQASEIKMQQIKETKLKMQTHTPGSEYRRYPYTDHDLILGQLADLRSQFQAMQLGRIDPQRAFISADHLNHVNGFQFPQTVPGKRQSMPSHGGGYALVTDAAVHDEHPFNRSNEGKPPVTRLP